MTNDELQAAWLVDITSLEKFNEVLNATYNWLPRHGAYTSLLPRADSSYVYSLDHGDDAWPLRRDYIRELIGAYQEPTSVLKWIRTQHANTGAAQKFPHVARQDSMNMVAFSNDANQAKLDRKRTMTIGRFLRENLMYAPEREIQRLEQQHRSELDDTFKLAETVDAIERIYENMEGDSGCMRYNRSNFNLSDYHPSAVYASPGMGVAYTEDENGLIKSRSVVWHNPDDPSDKRYVRVYGDVILKKKLERAGYKLRGLVGAKLKVLRDSKFTNNDQVVMPWIDPAGGIHATGVDRSFDSQYAIRFAGEEFFTMISADQYQRYARAGIACPDVQTQNGKATVPEVDPSAFTFVCPLSRVRVNRMDDSTNLYVDANGAIVRVAQKAIDAIIDTMTTIQAQVEGRLQRVYCTREAKAQYAIPGFPGHYNNEDTRTAVGVCELDKAFYTDSERWHARAACVFIEDALGVRTYIKKDDAVMLYSEEGNKFIHVEMVRPMKKEGCVPVAVYNGYRGIAHKDHKFLAVTRGGKRVLTNMHEVQMLHDGVWEYTRNVKTITVAGVSFNVHKDDESAATLAVTDKHVREQYAQTYEFRWRYSDVGDAVRRRNNRMITKMSHGYMGAQAYMKKDESIVAIDYYNKPTDPQAIYEAAQGILVMKDDSEWLRRTLGYNFMRALPWARVIVQIMEGMKAYDREQEMMLAEANAIEAPLPVQQLVQQVNSLGDAGIDMLVAEVDEALATSVVRRWPRLNAVGDPSNPAHQVTANGQPVRVVIREEDAPIEQQVFRTVQNADGTVSPAPTPVPVPNFTMVPQGAALVPVMHTPHMDMPIAHPDRIQAAADDALLRELQSVGLATFVIDESTVFPESVLREET